MDARSEGEACGRREDATARECPYAFVPGHDRTAWLLGFSQGRIATARPQVASGPVGLDERRSRRF